MTKQDRSEPIRIWALIGARAGDNDQVIALAEAIGLPFETKQLTYNGLRHLGPRLLGLSLISLDRSSRDDMLAEEPPHLTISAGHRSVAAVRSIQRRSGGRTRAIHIGFPRVSPGHFDLVITTPQYAIADHPNVLRLPFALTRAATALPDPADNQTIASLPHPRRLLVLGGPTLFWDLDAGALMETLRTMIEEARVNGGSVIATTSPRTPPPLRERVATTLQASDVPILLAEPRKPPRYASLLAAADSIRVTADSVAMLSDAIWTGKPVAMIPIRKSALGHAVIGMLDAIRPGRRIYPQDLRFFWRALHEVGITDDPAKPQTSTSDVMCMVMDRVRPILGSLK